MISIIRSLFLIHWERKLFSLLLAIVIWLAVNHSLITTRTMDHISVRIVNLPVGMTIEGLQPNGVFSKKISLSLQGNAEKLAVLSSNDLEVVLDSLGKSGNWDASISRQHLRCLNPDIDLSKTIKKVTTQKLPIVFTRAITSTVPVFVTKPIGKGPENYQFLDVWPYELSLKISGAEGVIEKIKEKGVSLTFNLDDIAATDLETKENHSDEVSFQVPEEWKRVYIRELSDHPFSIDDPQAQELRIDFVKNDFHLLTKQIPISLFFPVEHHLTVNPQMYSLALGGAIQQLHGIYTIHQSLYTKGVSRLFLELVQDMLQISVLVVAETVHPLLEWSLQFQNAPILEDRYVTILLPKNHEKDGGAPSLQRREAHLRNRFRNYMNRFQLYQAEGQKLNLKVEMKGRQIVVEQGSCAS